MKKISIWLAIVCMIVLVGCADDSSSGTQPLAPPMSAAGASSEDSGEAPQKESSAMPTMTVQVGDKKFTAILYNNESAQKIASEMPFTVSMEDYAAQEKVADLSFALPAAPTETPATIAMSRLGISRM